MISAGYNGYGDLTSVTDTLGRVISFNYDGNSNLNSITQTWDGQTHTWGTFGWETKTFTPSFSSLSPIGSYTGIPVLNQVGLADGSYYKFEYNNFGQVNAIKRYTSDGNPGAADDIQRSSMSYDYDTTQPDSPRITASRVTAENWQTNVQTVFEDLGSGWHRITMPDGTQYAELYQLSGWQRGLTAQTEVWGKSNPSASFIKQKWTTTSWTQENPALSYQLNPRITETNVYDAGGNRRRATIDYSRSDTAHPQA